MTTFTVEVCSHHVDHPSLCVSHTLLSRVSSIHYVCGVTSCLCITTSRNRCCHGFTVLPCAIWRTSRPFAAVVLLTLRLLRSPHPPHSRAASSVSGPYYADDSCCEESHSGDSDASDDGESSGSDMPSSHSSGEVNGEDVVGTDSDDSDEEYKDDDVEEMDDGWTDEVCDESTPQAFRPVPLSHVAAAALAGV